jgi:hypothetical protein
LIPSLLYCKAVFILLPSNMPHTTFLAIARNVVCGRYWFYGNIIK